MKTLIITLTTLFLSSMALGQDFQGKAIYKTYRGGAKIEVKGDDAMSKQLTEALKRQSQRTYILYFNTTESMYKQEAELKTSMDDIAGVTVDVLGGSQQQELYKNVAKGTFRSKRDFMGKTFSIVDTLPKPKWELLPDKKTIGNYTCYKATMQTVRTINKPNPETYKFEPVVDTLVTTVWYTPEIAVSNGPQKFFGLPGLILEVQQGKSRIACTEIVLNTDEKVVIEAPRGGQKVSQKEFDNIKEKKMEEMTKRFKNNREGDGKGGISIRIGK